MVDLETAVFFNDPSGIQEVYEKLRAAKLDEHADSVREKFRVTEPTKI